MPLEYMANVWAVDEERARAQLDLLVCGLPYQLEETNPLELSEVKNDMQRKAKEEGRQLHLWAVETTNTGGSA